MLDKLINEEIYKLYEISEEDIEIINNSLNN